MIIKLYIYAVQRIALVIQMLILALLGLNGQSYLRFENYYIEDGLPHSRTRATFQDNIGWIWVGTVDGLARFDGISFKTYALNLAPGAKTSASVMCFWETKDSTIWIGTEKQGLARYNPKMDRFESYSNHDSTGNCISNNEIHSIASDSSGILWIGTSGGLNRFDPLSSTFQFYRYNGNDSSGLSSDTVSKVFFDSNERLWIGTHRGLDYMDPETGTIENYPLFAEGQTVPLANNRIEDIVQDENGNILVASYYFGLFVLNPSIKKSRNIIPDKDYARSFLVRSLLPDENGSIWVGTRGGVYILDQSYNVVAHFSKALNDPNSLGHNSVRDIYKDQTGDIWVSHRSGISHANLKSMAFTNYIANEDDYRYLNDPEIYSIFQSQDRRIWLGTEAGGVNILDPVKNQFTYLTHDEYNSNTICSNCIKAIIEDSRGNFWIGTFLEGLDCYDEKSKKFIHYTHDPKDKNSLRDNSVWALHEDQEGNIWVGTDKGLDRFNPLTRQFIHLETGSNIPVHVIFEDRSGNLFFGSDEGSLMVLKPDLELVEYDIPVRTIFEDSRNRIWIGSENLEGLNQFNLDSGIVRSYTSMHGLPSNEIYGILEDNSSILWLSTGQGLCRFDPEKGEFQTFKAEDGIQGDRFYYGAFAKCYSGELLFGGQNGLTRFDPDHISENSVKPPVVITDFKIFNKTVPINQKYDGRIILEKSISNSEEIEVDYAHSVLTFEYVALNYMNSSKNEYAHMLEGFDNGWNYVGTNRSATYTNLHPGEYVFRVRASNNNGIWNEAGTSLKIIVNPPFVQTNFFRFLMLFLASLIVYFIIQFFLKREKLKNQLVLERVKSKELHKMDMMKFQFFTNISHEIRTPISLIVSPLARIKNTSLPREQIMKDIDVVHRNALRLGKLVDQLLDYRKLEAGKLKLELSRGNIVAFLENVIYMFSEMSKEKNVELKFFSALDQIQIFFDPDKIEKVMFNLLSNSFKHTPAGGIINVTVSLTYLMNQDLEEENQTSSGEYIQIIVRDTGSGIEESKKQHIFDRFYQGKPSENSTSYGSGIGLSLSKELIKLHKGKISLKSQVGIGTEISVLFPVITTDPNEKEQARIQKSSESGTEISYQESNTHILEHLSEFPNPVVLVLEDNIELLDFIKSILQEDYTVLIAEDGEIGLELARESIPDLIISDVMMPKMDGIKFCKKIKQDFRTSHIPLILLTALSSKQHEKEGILGGADEYITKPFDPSLLKIRVDQLLATRRLLKEKYSRDNILKPNSMQANSESPDDKFLARLVSIVEENISDPEFGTVKISREIGVSRTQLYRKMAALTDMTVKEFIRNIRLKKAAQLIDQDQVNISEAAYAVGFLQVAYFRKCFKEMYGMTPSEYAKLQKTTSS